MSRSPKRAARTVAPPQPSLGDRLLKHTDDIRVQAHLSLDADGSLECHAEIDAGAIVTGPESLALLSSLFARAAERGDQ